VTVCLAGGEREVGIAGYDVRMARKLAKRPVEIEQVCIERQCDNEGHASRPPITRSPPHQTRPEAVWCGYVPVSMSRQLRLDHVL